jgi:bifunctional non-homologous end joining protein LigD
MIAIPAPMLATDGGRPFTSADWHYEVKYDGYRCLSHANSGSPVELRTKSGADCTKRFPEVTEVLSDIRGGPHVVDGEICVLDDIGRSDFERLQARARHRRWYPGCDPVALCAFDLLYLNGRNVMGLPLLERKRLLRELLEPLLPRLVIVGELPAEASLFHEAVIGARLEGFVAKRSDSTYRPGVVSRDWLKIKRTGWYEGRTWRS